jgi:hypothetical protein
MSRRNQQGKQQLRRAQRELSVDLESQQGTYQRPDHGRCDEKRWEMPLDDANTIRLQFIRWSQGGRLVDFFVGVQVITPSAGWVNVEYFDCCHGYCHLHTQNGEQVQGIAQLDDVDDVRRAFDQVSRNALDRARIIRDNQGG